MQFPEQLIEIGINAPKEHQRIISKLTTGLGLLYYHQQKINLEPLPETMIDEGQTSPVPDILLYDNEHFSSPIIIEVCHTNGLKNDLKKIQILIDQYDYGVVEGFAYDYRDDKWYKYLKNHGFDQDRPSYSNYLDLDLATLL